MTATTVIATTGRVRKRRSLFFRTFAGKPHAIIAAVLLVLVVGAAVFAPLLPLQDPLEQNLADAMLPPGPTHLLGADQYGRDILSRIVWGAQPALLGVAQGLIVFIVLGMLLGLIAGYFGGVLDSLISRVLDLLLAIPAIVLLLVVIAVFSNGQGPAMITLGVLLSPQLARVVRGVVHSTRGELYVDAARVSGIPTARILFVHVLPRVLGPAIVQCTIFAGTALVAQASLSFLGLGVTPPAPSWGSMVADASQKLSVAPWFILIAGLVIAVTVLAIAIIGDAVREGISDAAGTPRRIRRNRTTDAPPPAQRTPVVEIAADVDVRVTSPRSAASVFTSSPVATGEPSDPDVAIVVRGLTVEVAGPDGRAITLVDGVDFEVRRGEAVALVGESGCGKSVTGRSLLGLGSAGLETTGSIRLDGRELVGLRERELSRLRGSTIALIPQEPMMALDPVFRVGSQLVEVLRRHHGINPSEARVRAIGLLEQVQLPEPARIMRLYPHEMSGGMAQRVVIAMALAGDPDVIVADEPTTALDVTVQAEVLDLLRALQQERGMAMILITHDWGVAATSCDRAMVMYAGQIVERADLARVVAQPAHPYTRALLLSRPERMQKGVPLVAIPGTVPPPGSWPEGCRFADRCELATQQCRTAPIPLLRAPSGRESRCIHADRLDEEFSR